MKSTHVITHGRWMVRISAAVNFEKELMNNSKLFGMKKSMVPTLTMSKYTIRWKRTIRSIDFKWNRETRKTNVVIMYPNNIMRNSIH